MAERLEELSVGRVVPSVLTLLGLCSGITAIKFAIGADWNAAVVAIIFAMLLTFEFGGDLFRQPIVSGLMIAVSASLMVSRLPTPSIKYMRPARQHRLLVWAFIGLLTGFMITWPWITATVGMVIYLTS